MSEPKIWNIWKPKANHPHWAPDEQTYAVEDGKGYYNDEIYEIIDKAVTKEAYDQLAAQLAESKAGVEQLKESVFQMQNAAIDLALGTQKLRSERDEYREALHIYANDIGLVLCTDRDGDKARAVLAKWAKGES